MMRKTAAHTTSSSGNVFCDLGFSPEEAEHLKLRSQLMGAVRDTVRRRGLTQARAAKLMGVTQPRISDLMRGKIDLFSIDMLVSMLVRSGLSVRLTIQPAGAVSRGEPATTPSTRSPLAGAGVNLGPSTEQLVSIVREGRRRSTK